MLCSALQEQEEQAAVAKFQQRSSKMHHLLSTSNVPGIYRSPYQALTNTVPVLSKIPLEDQIRASRKQLVSSTLLDACIHAFFGVLFLPSVRLSVRPSVCPSVPPSIHLFINFKKHARQAQRVQLGAC